MGIRRTSAAAATAAAMVVLAACGNGNGDAEGDEDLEIGEEDDFVTDLTFGTGGTAGVYYPLGGEYAQIFEDTIDDISVDAISTDASVFNIGQISQEEMQLGMAQSDTFITAINGEDDFEGADIDNVGWIAGLYPEAAHIVTMEGSGIESVEDLEGANIAVGAPGSGTRAVSDAILAAYGIEDGDYEAYEEEFDDSQSLLQDGNIDASIFVVGTPTGSLNEMAATSDVTLLGLDEDVASDIAGDTYFDEYTIESDNYDFLDDDVLTLSVSAAVLGSTTQISEDLAYDITAAIFDNAEDITLPQGELISHEDALLGIGDAPLHPGAERYYEEQDVELP
ncbi:TAXI family TRAP transporter solute-binding subunit [Nesterenkonia aerolata]|uniref:TAXI family TRAP transporter solute-binding subunit n=1 Tax=Nesterenkonia aerolata TaxID=3074079 RepID=A0ABU2DNH8_9MICC|nr:TAXI family TRAP transporter solute-binding subunit [Nesterenkonia sp. LY-0111]MDR8018063.1 TAXI family TRAP transporter solute-binding subunit [Nesterenkonia sp. LY-0111]